MKDILFVATRVACSPQWITTMVNTNTASKHQQRKRLCFLSGLLSFFLSCFLSVVPVSNVSIHPFISLPLCFAPSFCLSLCHCYLCVVRLFSFTSSSFPSFIFFLPCSLIAFFIPFKCVCFICVSVLFSPSFFPHLLLSSSLSAFFFAFFTYFCFGS